MAASLGNRVSPAAAAPWIDTLDFVDERHGWAAGGYGTVTRTLDGGLSWQAVNIGAAQSVNGVDFVDLLHGWAVGHGGTIVHSARRRRHLAAAGQPRCRTCGASGRSTR